MTKGNLVVVAALTLYFLSCAMQLILLDKMDHLGRFMIFLSVTDLFEFTDVKPASNHKTNKSYKYFSSL